MNGSFDYEAELMRTVLTLAVTVLTLMLGWFVGNRIGMSWALRQKRRELYLSLMSEFYRLYGEFFAIWKAWDHFHKYAGDPEYADVFPKDTSWAILNRACAAEAGVEAIFVRLCAERVLGPEDTAVLGRFRQAFQRLRETIRDHRRIPWVYSEHPEYLAFKTLACRVAALMLRQDEKQPRNGDDMCENLIDITSNKWEEVWVTGERTGEPAGRAQPQS